VGSGNQNDFVGLNDRKDQIISRLKAPQDLKEMAKKIVANIFDNGPAKKSQEEVLQLTPLITMQPSFLYSIMKNLGNMNGDLVCQGEQFKKFSLTNNLVVDCDNNHVLGYSESNSNTIIFHKKENKFSSSKKIRPHALPMA
jgi:hypothetical protein